MSLRSRYRIPSRSILVTFESAARHGNFSRAAVELRTSQATVSRRIAELEASLSTRLFERSRTGVALTEAGGRFRNGVVAGLYVIRAATAEAANLSPAGQVVIACPDEAIHLAAQSPCDALQEALGGDVRIRLLVHDRASGDAAVDPAADLVLAWNAANPVPDAAPGARATVFGEFGGSLVAVLTAKGRRNPDARACLSFLERRSRD